jgi:molybdopterin-guanine dinucleotide biosynthesis protein A
MPNFTVAIIAGGKSSRMGTDKSFVSLLGKPMIEHVLASISDLGQDETILITNRPGDYAHLCLPMFADVIPDQGALGGIYTALYYSQTADVLTLACDMPFLNPDLLRYIIGLGGEYGSPYDVIVPRVDNHPQGLHALYNKSCLPSIRAKIDTHRLKVISFYDDVRVRYLEPAEWSRLDPRGRSFHNVNTPEELQTAQQIAALDQPPAEEA